MAFNIDLDRGVMMKAYENIDVYMYLDKPGVYYNAHGTEVSEELAKKAHFDTVRYGKLRERAARMAIAQAEIEKALSVEESDRKIIKEQFGYKLVQLPLDRYTIIDPDDEPLLHSPTTKVLGEQLFAAVIEPELIRQKKEAKGQK